MGTPSKTRKRRRKKTGLIDRSHSEYHGVEWPLGWLRLRSSIPTTLALLPGGINWPPIPPILENPCIRILAVLKLWKEDDLDDREEGTAQATRILRAERQRIEQIIDEDLGTLAWATFSLERPSEGEVYRDELESQSCVYRFLREAADSADDPEVKARAKDVLDRVGRAGD